MKEGAVLWLCQSTMQGAGVAMWCGLFVVPSLAAKYSIDTRRKKRCSGKQNFGVIIRRKYKGSNQKKEVRNAILLCCVYHIYPTAGNDSKKC
jgi:hypothetical protein